ncbi:MAG: HTTM domain-containing protein [Planctomyces sp.]
MNQPLSKSELFYSRAFQSTDYSGLAFFRIAFGFSLAAFAYKYLSSPALAADFITPRFHLTYFGFEWVRPWPGSGMYLHFLVMLIAAIGVAAGLFYRLAAVLLLFTFTHVFLIERALYNNHYYLIILLCLLAVAIPLNRVWSVDAFRPGRQNSAGPVWGLWLLRFQLGVVYFYGGIAKIDSDWLQGQPMKMWLAARSELPVIGEFLTRDWSPGLFAWGGLLFDLAIVPLLLWSRTALPGFLLLIAFHLMNSVLFQIGLFPWLMIAASTIFFRPDWPRRLLRTPVSAPQSTASWSEIRTPLRTAGMFALSVYVLLQVLLPFRHLLYEGNPSWTENGQLFAWRMMLRQKLTGIRFYAAEPRTGRHGVVDIMPFLNQRQAQMMSRDPDLIVHFVGQLASFYEQQGISDLEIRVRVLASLNGRKPQYLIDPSVNLAKEVRRIGGYSWVLPLVEPLREDPWNLPIDQWEKLVPPPSPLH